MSCPRCHESRMGHPHGLKREPAPTRRAEDYLFYLCKHCGCEFAVKENTPGFRSYEALEPCERS